MSGLPWGAAVESSAGLGVWELPSVRDGLEVRDVQLRLTSESLQSCRRSAPLRARAVDMCCVCAVGISTAFWGKHSFLPFSGYLAAHH